MVSYLLKAKCRACHGHHLQTALTLHLLPAFDGLAVEDITTDDVQRLFNGMTGAKATKDKAKMVLNQILDAAIEDKLISQNPLKSKRVKITGKASKATAPYSIEEMRFLVQHIGDIKNPVDRAYMALQALHPLRPEEVLGLQAADLDTENMAIHIRRAVTHPTRNQPEIKDTKTDSSFRTTVLTDLYDQTKDIKLAQAAAGHTTSAMTLKYYVKGRKVPQRPPLP